MLVKFTFLFEFNLIFVLIYSDCIRCLDAQLNYEVDRPAFSEENSNGLGSKHKSLDFVNLWRIRKSLNDFPLSNPNVLITSKGQTNPENFSNLKTLFLNSKNPLIQSRNAISKIPITSSSTSFSNNSTIPSIIEPSNNMTMSSTIAPPKDSTVSFSNASSNYPISSTIVPSNNSTIASSNASNNPISSTIAPSQNSTIASSKASNNTISSTIAPSNNSTSSSNITSKNPMINTTTQTPTVTTTKKHKKHTTLIPSNISLHTTHPTRMTTPHSISNGSSSHNGSRPIAKARSGIYLGYWSRTSRGVQYASFSGIRYVKPMTPEYRFKWAELVEDSNKVMDASTEGPDCPQWNLHRKSNAIVGNEDCLFMNIYTPKVDGKYPVMVVIPCGHFVFDSASRYLNGPDYFMDTREIIMVIFNYRLGPLGYADFRSAKYPSNLGMKDQVLGLKWVQRNIAAFGGDPKRVTLQGTSSGAVSVHYHMISPLSKGLFHAGISESGTALDPWSNVHPRRSRELLISLASRTGCESAVPVSFDASADSLAECFRNKSVHQLLAATRHFNLEFVQMLFLPVVEVFYHKAFMPMDPFIAPEHYKPWLSGQNSDETGIINSLNKPLFWLLRVYLCSNAYQGVPQWLNFAETASDPWNVTTTIMYHYGKTYKPSASNIISLLKEAGEDGVFWNPHYMSMLKHKAPKYSYLFAYRQTKPGGAFLHPDRGVTHSEEQFYLFIKQGIDIQAQNPPEDAEMSRKLVRLWTNFVKYHNPTPDKEKILPKWERWTEDNNLFYTIEQNSTKMKVDPKLDNYKFWKDLPYRDKLVPFPYYPASEIQNRPPHHWHLIHHRKPHSSSSVLTSSLHLFGISIALSLGYFFTIV